jgi:hypothetical protein
MLGFDPFAVSVALAAVAALLSLLSAMVAALVGTLSALAVAAWVVRRRSAPRRLSGPAQLAVGLALTGFAAGEVLVVGRLGPSFPLTAVLLLLASLIALSQTDRLSAMARTGVGT